MLNSENKKINKIFNKNAIQNLRVMSKKQG